jgi:BASS family bile acid:Na+ symporter
LRTIIQAGVPVLIVLLMTIVGLELTISDLRRVLHYPLHVIIALFGQVVMLPAMAAALILLLHPAPAIAGGLILTAAAPQAISSNYFCVLGRADTALSVTLTAVSSALAIVSMPLAAGLASALVMEQEAGFSLPAVKVMQQVAVGLLLPIAAGMLVRHYAPRFSERNRVRFQRVSLVAVAVMLTVLLVDQSETIQGNLAAIVLTAVLFTVGAAALGLGVAKVFGWNRDDTVTMIAAFPSRSLSIATLIAVNVLGRLEFLSFAVLFFLVQTLLLVPAMIWSRRARVRT